MGQFLQAALSRAHWRFVHALVLAALLSQGELCAQTFTWTGNGAANTWSTTGNWSGGSAPTSGINTNLIFGGTTRLTADQNILSPFVLNSLSFTSTAGAFDITDLPLNFSTNSGSVLPTIVQNSANTITIDSALVFTNNLTYSGTGSGIFNGVISGAGNLTKSGAGTLALGNAANTFTGTTSVLAGTLSIGANAPSGASGALGNATSAVVLGDTAGSNAASLLSSGAFTIARPITVQAGTSGALTLGGLNAFGTASFTGNVALNQNVNLTSAPGGTVSFGTGVISGVGNVNIVGGGTVALSGTNTYTGTTSVLAGTLSIGANAPSGANGALGNATSALLLGDTTGSSNASLLSSGALTVARPITVQAGTSGALTLGGSNTSGTASFTGNVTLNQNVNLTAATGGTVSFATGAISGIGNVAIVGGGTVALSGTNTYTGTTSVLAGTLSINANAPSGANGALGHATSAILLGDTSGSNNASLLASGIVAIDRNITVQAGSSGTLTLGVTSSGNATYRGSVTLGNSVTVALGSGAVSFNPGTLSGAGNVTVSGTGSLYLSGANSYTGTTTITGGYVSATGDVLSGVNGPLGNSTTAVLLGATSGSSSSTLNLTASTFSRDITVQAGGTGNVQFGSGSSSGGTVTGNILLNRSLILYDSFAGSTVTGFSGMITGAGGITQIGGGGTVVLSGANSYLGSTTVSAGTLQLGAANSLPTGTGLAVNGGTFDLNGFSETVGSLTSSASSGTVALNSATLTVSGGSYSGALTGSGGIVKAGGGTLLLSGTNSYSGPTTISAGYLEIISGALGNTSGVTFDGVGATLYGYSTTVSTNAPITLGTGNQIDAPSGVTFTLGGVIGGSGGLSKIDNGTLILANAGNTYTGGTTLLQGTLQIASDGALGDPTGGITFFNSGTVLAATASFASNRPVTLSNPSSGYTIDVAASQTLTLSGVVSGTNSSAYLIKQDTGLLVLSGPNTYTATTQINAGVLCAADGVGLPTGSLLLFNGGTLESNGAFTRTYGGSPGQVEWTSAGGGFAANGGTLTVQIANGGNPLSVGPNIPTSGFSLSSATADSLVDFQNNITSAGNVFTINVADNPASATDLAKISGAISSTSYITKAGTGTLWLSGNNSYTYALIQDGALRVADGAGLPSAAVIEFLPTSIAQQPVIETNGTFTRPVTSSAGGIIWEGSGGFAAQGGPLTVRLNNGTGTLNWFVNSYNFSNPSLIFGSVTADNVVDFQNGIDLNAGTRTINVVDNPFSTTDSAKMSGVISDGGISKIGAGSLLLTAANTYAGSTTILNGSLLVGADSLAGASGPLGAGTSAVLVGDTSGTNNAALLAAGAFSIGHDVTIQSGSTGMVTIGGTNTSGTTNFTGNIILNKSAVFTAASGGSVTFNTGAISGAGGITAAGGGTINLAAANTFTGQTSITSATLVVGNSQALGTGSAAVLLGDSGGSSNASLLLGTPLTLTRDVTVQAGNSGTISLGSANTSAVAGFTGNIVLNKDAWLTAAPGGTVNFTTGTISGTGGITASGGGTVQLAGLNTYSGVTSVVSGILSIAANAPAGASGALGSATSPVLVGDTTGSANAALLATGAFTIGRDITVQAGSSGTMTIGGAASVPTANFTGNIVLNQSAVFAAGAGATINFSTGTISGSGGMILNGPGTITLAGNTTFSGGITLNSTSTLQLNASDMLNHAGNLTFSGGTLNLNNNSETVNSLSGSGTIELGTGTLTNSGGTFAGTVQGSGTLAIASGTLQLQGPTTFANGAAVSLASAGATLDTNGNALSVGNLSGSGSVLLSSNIAFTVNQATNATVSTAFGGSGGAFHMDGAATLTLAGNGSGIGSVFVDNGTLKLGAASALPAAAPITIADGATLDLGSTNLVRGSIAGTGNLVVGSGGLSIAADSPAIWDVVISGSGGLTTTGSATVTLTGDNTYSGATNVNAGQLIVQGHSSSSGYTINSTGALVVDGGTVDMTFGSIRANPGTTATYEGATIDGGFLRGTGSHVIADAGTTTFNGVTTFSDATLTQNGIANFVDVSNGGALINNNTLTWDGGANATSGQVTVNSTINASSWSNSGLVTINNGGILNNDVSDLVSGGGSRITVNAGGALNLQNGTSLDLQGSLLVNNGTIAGTTNVYYGGLAKGSGTYGAVNVFDGGSFSPGNSPGTVSTGPTAWNSGGHYVWEINQLAANGGAVGANPGWDFWNTGSLSITGPFSVDITSLTLADTAGALNLWKQNVAEQWLIATATNHEFSSADFANLLLTDTAFTPYNTLAGNFSLESSPDGDSLFLDYTPSAVPEPSSLVLSLLAMAPVGWRMLRQRRRRLAPASTAASLKIAV